MKARVSIIVCVFVAFATLVSAQTTDVTYQGSLKDGVDPANANYDFEFRLFDALTSGAQIGPVVSRNAIPVLRGIFSVRLDFGDQFPGANRFLEIRLRPAGGAGFTTLSPREQVNSSPYAVKSINAQSASTATNALQLGGVAANQYVITTDPRMSDARNPLPGSSNYIHNSVVVQTGSFNIDGDGSAGVFKAQSQFNIGNNRILAATGSANTIAGIGAGTSATGDSNSFFGRSAGGGVSNTGSSNAFFGERAGALNSTGFANSFFGAAAGVSNTTGGANSFFGTSSGASNTTGASNSFYGVQAGFSNTNGINNSFFGRGAGIANTEGFANTFVGFEAGMTNTLASGNSFFGSRAGRLNTALFNSFFGSSAGASNTDSSYNSFFGYNAGQLNTAEYNSFFGSLAGVSNTTGNANSFFGDEAGEDNTTGGHNTLIGRWAGNSNSTGSNNTMVGFNVGLLNTVGADNTFVGDFAGSSNANGNNNTVIGAQANVASGSLVYATAVGSDAIVSSSNTVQLGRANGFDTLFAPGLIRVNGLGVAGATAICRNASNQLSTCSSSLRYKMNVSPYFDGLNIVSRLRPITFNWKDGGIGDVGFGAEQVYEVEPLLTTRNSSGEIEGVKYAQITTVLVNAVNEQQTQIEEQKQRIGKQDVKIAEQQLQLTKQQRQLDELRSIVCLSNPTITSCKRK